MSGRNDGVGRGEGGADGAELDVAVGNVGVGAVLLDVSGDTGGCGARSTGNTRGGGTAGGGVVGVEPEHVGCVVIPNGENENDTTSEGLTEDLEATLALEGGGITEGSLERAARVSCRVM